MSFFLIIKKEIRILAKIIIPIFLIMILSFAIIIQILSISFSLKPNFTSRITYATLKTVDEGYNQMEEFDDLATEISLTNFYPNVTVNEDGTTTNNYFNFISSSKDLIIDDDWIWYLNNQGEYYFSNKNYPDYQTIPDKSLYRTTGSIGKTGRFIDFNPYFINGLYTKGVINKSLYPDINDFPQNSILLNSEMMALLNVNVGDSIKINFLGQQLDLIIAGKYSSFYSSSTYILNASCFSDYHLDKYLLTYNVYLLDDYTKAVDKMNELGFTSTVEDVAYVSTMSLVNTIFIILVCLAILMSIILTITIYSFLNTIINRRKQFLYQLKLIGFSNKKLILCYGFLLFILIILAIVLGMIVSSISLSFLGRYFSDLFGYQFLFLNQFLSPLIIFVFFLLISLILLRLTLNNQTSKTAVEKIRGAEKC